RVRGRGGGLVADEAGESDHAQEGGENKAQPPGRAAEGGRFGASRGEQQGDAADERRQRDRRHLPVPVDRRVQEEGDVGAEAAAASGCRRAARTTPSGRASAPRSSTRPNGPSSASVSR